MAREGKDWEDTIQRSMPERAVYTRIPDVGPAVWAAKASGAPGFAVKRPYDARIDYRSRCGLPVSIAVEAKSVSESTYNCPKSNHQIPTLHNLHVDTGTFSVVMIELRGEPFESKWWWATATDVLVSFARNGRRTVRLPDLQSYGHSIAKLDRGRTLPYIDLSGLFAAAEESAFSLMMGGAR